MFVSNELSAQWLKVGEDNILDNFSCPGTNRTYKGVVRAMKGLELIRCLDNVDARRSQDDDTEERRYSR